MVSYEKPPFIACAGNIGSGKTTLCEMLAGEMGLPSHYEKVENNVLLEKFYRDPKAYAFKLQIELLANRIEQHQKVFWSGIGGVQDRTIYEDQIFCDMFETDGTFEPGDLHLYQRLLALMEFTIKPPDVIIFLNVPAEDCLARIHKRGRACEKGITIDYLQALEKRYETFIQQISKRIKVIQVNWDGEKNIGKVVQQIHQILNQPSKYTITF